MSLLHQHVQAILVPITFTPDFLYVMLPNLEPMRHVVLQQKLQHIHPAKLSQPCSDFHQRFQGLPIFRL